MSKKFITNTASIKATIADIRNLDAKKIKLNGKSIPSKVIDDRGDFVTDQDLWGTTITTDENGVVNVSHKFLSNPNAYSYSAWNRSIKSVKNNKAYTSADASGEPICNIQTNMIKDGSYMFAYAPFSSFNGDLSSLTKGELMFAYTLLTWFSGDLSSLVNGNAMFCGTPLTSFNGDLSSLVDGISMFYSTSLTSFNRGLDSLVYGNTMFKDTPLTSFNSDLSSLVDGNGMFSGTSLTSFNKDLNSLVYGTSMFSYTLLDSFNADLNSLVDGLRMFIYTPLDSFSGDLSSLVYGFLMFSDTSLKSFSSDLSSLVDGYSMFSNTHKRSYDILHYGMIGGERSRLTTHFKALGLTSFSGDLSSLQSGYAMFGDGINVTYKNEAGVTETTKNITPLDEKSVMIIADTIKDLNGFTDWDEFINTSDRGVIHIGYDSTVCDASNIDEYCTEIMNKGWKVYLNGTVQTTDDGIEGIATTAEDGTVTVTPIPYYCKPVEVEQKKANWTDGEKYYIILGAQKVFGDDLSTYGMFTSIEDAAANMRFTPYVYVEETVEEN